MLVRDDDDGEQKRRNVAVDRETRNRSESRFALLASRREALIDISTRDIETEDASRSVGRRIKRAGSAMSEGNYARFS